MGEALHVWIVNGAAALGVAVLLTALVRWVRPASFAWWAVMAGLACIVCASFSFNYSHREEASLPPVLRGNAGLVG